MNKLDKIFQILRKLYPDPKTELSYSTPFQLMIAVILSAQTTDKQVNKITPPIFKQVKMPKDLLKYYKNEMAFQKAVS
jgi:endonuclease III